LQRRRTKMGRAIRKVPKGWIHPKDEEGDDIPLYDKDFETAAAAWKAEFYAWEKGEHESQKRNVVDWSDTEYWEYADGVPDRETYRPKWDEEPTCYQIYETVSEGTPVSPVFETEEEMLAWLLQQGYSEHAAREFIRHGSVWSMSVMPTAEGPTIAMNIHGFDLMPDREGEE
jgi:hypothetical protein